MGSILSKLTDPGVANPLVELDGTSRGISLEVGGNVSKSESRHFRV